MTALTRNTTLWRHITVGIMRAVRDVPNWLRQPHDIKHNTTVPDDFFGINVATSEDPGCDDYIISALLDLGIRNIRLNYSYEAVGGATERFLSRLLDEDFDVLLALLPPRQDAAAMTTDPAVQARWRDFVEDTLQHYGPRLASIEIGNTPNRGRWAGYSSHSYLTTWQIASQAAHAAGRSLAGPNVSDFEPIYNVGFLSAMGKIHSVPDIHTNNLFVERVVEPEAFDHRVAGKFATRLLNLNLIKKAQILKAISHQHGIKKTYCTYTCWSRKRLTRWSATPEKKNADYLLRYLVIAAASGTLDRVYWGPLICERDGLIACGDRSYPDIDNVSYYREVRGDVDQFMATAAFHALRFTVKVLRGATCAQAYNDVDGVHHFFFKARDGGSWHIIWCADRKIFPLDELYSAHTLATAEFYTPEGDRLPNLPGAISEQPLLLHWPEVVPPPDIKSLQQMSSKALTDVVYWPRDNRVTHTLAGDAWRGAYTIPSHKTNESPAGERIPDLLVSLPQCRKLRDKRNKLWNVAAPWWGSGEQTIKLNRAKGIKKLTYQFLPSKGRRHWNNATEMLRLGVNTPEPLGFFEQTRSSAADSYYICRFIEGAFSCRDVFTAFKNGHSQYEGIEKDEWLHRIGKFVAHMHWRGIIHRDLSSGNLMMTCENGEIEFYLIDIGRAIIDRPLSIKARMRFKDLNRICYKLNWPDRELLIKAYDQHTKQPLPKWWRLSLSSYDWKQNSKKTLKGNRKSKSRPAAGGR
ncbi:MAG: lipopolysaccharide kinase InaA family protein [bacterium]